MFTIKRIFIHKGNYTRFCTTGTNQTKDILNFWYNKFKSNAVPEPKESIKHILNHVRSLQSVQKNPQSLTAKEVATVTQMCEKRLKRMPIQYIIEEWDFRNLCLKMSPPVFIPRPETEMLVDLVLEEIRSKNVTSVLELCCGSGAISLSLLSECPHLKVTAVDQSGVACRLTEENSKLHQLSHRLSVVQCEIGPENCASFIQEKFDVVVANPPYVPSKDMDDLLPEITLYEDLAALHGGEEGLDVVKLILTASEKILHEGGKLFLEVDPSQPEAIKRWLQCNHLGLVYDCCRLDFCGKERFVVVRKYEKNS